MIIRRNTAYAFRSIRGISNVGLLVHTGQTVICHTEGNNLGAALYQKSSRLLRLMGSAAGRKADKNFKIKLLKQGAFKRKTAAPAWPSDCFLFVWKRHKDHPQCYLVSPPVHQSGLGLLGIDLFCSRINAPSLIPIATAEIVRDTVQAETSQIQHYMF